MRASAVLALSAHTEQPALPSVVTEPESDDTREVAFLRNALDGVAEAVLHAADPWAAYRAAEDASGALLDALEWLPHGGSVYIAWAEVIDLYETGKTPVSDAFAVLCDAATRWLAWSSVPSGPGLNDWLRTTAKATAALVRRDGTFWSEPGEG